MRRPSAASRRAAAALVAVLSGGVAAGCGAPASPAELTAGCLYGGSADSSTFAVQPREVNALARLDIAGVPGGRSFGGTCTGLLVGDSWVLTASHCTPDPAATVVTAHFGAAGLPAPPPGACLSPVGGGISSTVAFADPADDLMLVHLAQSPATLGIDVAPISPQIDENVQVGQVAELAGFGRTEDGAYGQLRFAAEPISTVTDTSLTVDGHAQSGACVGDSGGPLLRRDPAGALRTVGVLSAGSADCLGQDRYVRLRSAAAWLAATVADGVP